MIVFASAVFLAALTGFGTLHWYGAHGRGTALVAAVNGLGAGEASAGRRQAGAQDAAGLAGQAAAGGQDAQDGAVPGSLGDFQSAGDRVALMALGGGLESQGYTEDKSIQFTNLTINHANPQTNNGIGQPLQRAAQATSKPPDGAPTYHVVVMVHGGRREFETTSKTVEQLFSDNGIVLSDEDKVKGAYKDGTINSDLYIEIVRVWEDTEVKTEAIEPETIYRDNPDLAEGQSNVLGAGAPGEKKVVYRVTYEDDVVAERVAVSEEVLTKPISRLVERGTKAKAATGGGGSSGGSGSSGGASGGSSSSGGSAKASAPTSSSSSGGSAAVDTSSGTIGGKKYTSVISVKCTAYTSSYEDTGKRPGDKYFGITASGMKAREGVVAVDPSVIPLGTKLYIDIIDESIPDYGFCVAGDTGGAIKGNKIDLYFDASQAELNQFGVRKAKVYILAD
jgi:3D (Asp-Asp-Asp) domain-containing protein/uncharacterized membrane protein YgcG